MEEQARATARTAGIVLLITGVVELVYVLVYTAWSLLGTLWSGVGTGVSVLAASDSGSYVGAGLSAWGLVIELVQLVGTALLLVGAVIVVVGGLRFMQLRSHGLVTLASLVAIGLPLVSLALGALSVVSLNLCGAFCGCAPSLVMVVIGGIGGAYALMTTRNPMVVEVWDLQ